MSPDDWQTVAYVLAVVLILALALLILALGCIDDLADEQKRLRDQCARRILELENEKR